ncbi:MAG: hypothetical protein ACE5KT_02230 [Methanosarcinales archaeon]
MTTSVYAQLTYLGIPLSKQNYALKFIRSFDGEVKSVDARTTDSNGNVTDYNFTGTQVGTYTGETVTVVTTVRTGVRGDLNGDGKVTSLDARKTRNTKSITA